MSLRILFHCRSIDSSQGFPHELIRVSPNGDRLGSTGASIERVFARRCLPRQLTKRRHSPSKRLDRYELYVRAAAATPKGMALLSDAALTVAGLFGPLAIKLYGFP